MSTVVKDLGPVTAYADAVAAGYTGTKEEWQALMASYASVAEEAQEAKEGAEAAQEAAESARDAAMDAKEGAEDAVDGFGAVVTQATNQAVQTVRAEGTTQVGNVSSEGTTQVAAVQAKGTEVIQSIPADYTQLSSDVTQLKEDLTIIRDECGICIPMSTSGTTSASSSVQPVLQGLSFIKGHQYKYEVEYETASDTTSYLSVWVDGASSYAAVITINGGNTSGYGIYTAGADIPSGYVALTTNGRALKYKVTVTDLSATKTRIDTIEESTEKNTVDIEGADEAIENIKSNIIGIYSPYSASGSMVVGDGNKTILEGLSITENRLYEIDITFDDSLVSPAYVNLWTGSSSSYVRIWTVNAEQSSASFRFVAGFTSENALIKLDASNKAVNYSITFTDVSEEHFNNIQKNTNSIKTLSDETTVKAYNKKITRDISQDCTYTIGAVMKNGSIEPTEINYMHTNKIPVNPGDVVYMVGHAGVAYSRITAYFNGTALPEKVATNIRKYIVPNGVNQVVITVVNNAVKTDDLIVVDYYSLTVNSEKQIADDTAKNHSYTYAKRTPMVTFIDDDGNVECYTDLLPIFKAHNVPLVSAYMGDTNPEMTEGVMMSAEQCREIVQNGGEIVVHYNPSLTDLTLDEAERVVLKSKYWLEKHGFYSRLLVYSNGTSNSAIRAMVSKHFDAGFSGAYPRVSNTDRSNHGCIVQYAIHREPCGGLYYDYDPTSRSLQYFKDMIDECIASNGWLVFTMHSWLMPEGKKKPEYADTDQLGLLEDIIEYIEEKQQGGSSIKIVTASEGLDTFGNAWQAGDYLGHWNEQTLTNTATIGDHSEPGCAMNKLGQYDFPTGNNLNS